MPSVGVAMARSLGRRALDAPLASRDVLVDAADRVYNVKTAFSSWDNCMNAAFCKWPVIAVMVVGGLIAFSIVWCVIRRLCCGLACCCSCFQCLRCCGNCCGCCTPPRDKNRKYLEEPYIPPHHGYQAQAPMHATPPQYAEFDDPSKRGAADALPQMPSWEAGSSRKVKLDDVEMDQLNQTPTATAAVASTPHMSGAFVSTQASHLSGASPTSYRSSPAQQTRNGFGQSFGPGRQHTGPSPSPIDQRVYHDYASSPEPNSYGYDQPYAGYASPRPSVRRQQSGQQFAAEPYPTYPEQHQSFAAAPVGYGVSRQATGDSIGRMGAHTPYGADPRSRASPAPRQTPAPADYPSMPSARATPAPHDGGYRQPSYGPADYGADPVAVHRSPPPGWPAQNHVPDSAPQSPITNNAGFDFTSGYARPPTRGQDAHRHSESVKSRQDSYPGYKPYQPA